MPRRHTDHFSTTSIRVLADALNAGASSSDVSTSGIPEVNSVLATLADIDAEIHADMRQARAQLQRERTAHAHTRSELSAQVSLVTSLRAQLIATTTSTASRSVITDDGDSGGSGMTTTTKSTKMMMMMMTNNIVDVLNTACDCRRETSASYRKAITEGKEEGNGNGNENRNTGNVMTTVDGIEHAATCARRRALMSVATTWPTSTDTSTGATSHPVAASATGSSMARAHQHHQQLCDLLLAREDACRNQTVLINRLKLDNKQLRATYDDMCRLVDTLTLQQQQQQGKLLTTTTTSTTTTTAPAAAAAVGRRGRGDNDNEDASTLETTRRLDTLSIRLQRAGQAACDVATRVEERLKMTALDVSNLRRSVTLNTAATASTSTSTRVHHHRQPVITGNDDEDDGGMILLNDVDVDVDDVIMPVSSTSSTVPHATTLMTPRPRHQSKSRRRHHARGNNNNRKAIGKDHNNVETATSRALVDDNDVDDDVENNNNNKENAGSTMANRGYRADDNDNDDDIHSDVSSSSSSSDAPYTSFPNSPCRVRSPGMSMRAAPSLTPCSLSLSPVDEVDVDVNVDGTVVAPPPPMMMRMMMPMPRSSAVVIAGTDPRPSGVVRDEYDDATITVEDEDERRLLLERHRQRHRQHRHRRQAHEPASADLNTNMNMNPMVTTINTITSICPQPPQPQIHSHIPPSSSSPNALSSLSSSSTSNSTSTQQQKLELAQTEQHYRLATDELMRTMALQQDAHAKLRTTVQELTDELTRIDPNALADVARLRREAGETRAKMTSLDETVKQKDEEIQSLRRQLTKVLAEYDAVSVAHSYSNAELSKIRANDRRREKNKKLLQQQQQQEEQQHQQQQQQQQQQQHQKLKQKQRSHGHGHGHGHGQNGAGTEGTVEGRHVRKIHFR